jgi:toxin-antitoxin system PIN domain toxin
VWVALTYGGHVHHDVAQDWLREVPDGARLCFCRFTQLGLLRLLTARAVMGDDVCTQPEAWTVYDRWRDDDRVVFLDEPHGLDARFRSRTRRRHAAPQAWADAYLAAFAEASEITLVTFDRGFRGQLAVAVIEVE